MTTVPDPEAQRYRNFSSSIQLAADKNLSVELNGNVNFYYF
jgi:hypothetical protein